MYTEAGVEGEFKLKDGTKLYTKEWKAVETTTPKASVVFLHGFSDHCNAYYDTFPAWASKGIEVFSYDQRGWGRSALDKKQWGHSGGTDAIFADLDEILYARFEHVKTHSTNPPLFLVGHSAGGGLTLTYAYAGSQRDKLAGFMVWSPFIDLPPENKPPALKVAVGRLVGKIMPDRQLYNKSDFSVMSRDPSVCDDMKNDKLCHDTGTLIGFADMLTRGSRLQKRENISRFNKDKPVMVLHGDGDKVTSFPATKAFFEILDVKDKRFIELNNGYHKLHADAPDTVDDFRNNTANWILEHSNMSNQASSAENAPVANL